MTQKVTAEKVSDLDGSPAAETVRFGIGGKQYEIDLSPDQARKLRADLEPFRSRARRRSRPRGKRGAPALPEIREYARARGYETGKRERVPERIVEEYVALKRIGAG